MSKAQHTPGPWEFTGFGASKKVALVEYSDGMIEVYGENKESNARLIAAAPDLLAALEAQQSAEAYAIQYRHLPDAVGDIADAFEQAQELRHAALAKAKGE